MCWLYSSRTVASFYRMAGGARWRCLRITDWVHHNCKYVKAEWYHRPVTECRWQLNGTIDPVTEYMWRLNGTINPVNECRWGLNGTINSVTEYWCRLNGTIDPVTECRWRLNGTINPVTECRWRLNCTIDPVTECRWRLNGTINPPTPNPIWASIRCFSVCATDSFMQLTQCQYRYVCTGQCCQYWVDVSAHRPALLIGVCVCVCACVVAVLRPFKHLLGN